MRRYGASLNYAQDGPMQSKLGRALTELLAVVMAAGVATAYAGDYETGAQPQDQPKDCKKNPDDPRCKDERKK